MSLRLTSLLGIVVFLTLAWLLSLDRKRFPWRTVASGLLLQFVFALLILKTTVGGWLFGSAQAAVIRLNEFALEGARMVFGPLVEASLLEGAFGPGNGFVFALTITATIILIAALSSLFYHWGVLQRVVHGMAWVMQRVMRTTGSESLAAAANIFMGQTEAPLLVKPYLDHMTRSEILALMTGGMATVAGGVAAAYVTFGISAGHLVTASVMSAPAALLIAKILLPETEKSETSASASAKVPRTTVNSLDALCRGAGDGMKLSINVIAMLIAFVAVVALINHLLAMPWILAGGSKADAWTLQKIFGWINWPFAWLIGVPAADCQLVGQALGERIALNEFIGYLSLSREQATLDPRSYTLATYALCGFANFSSIAIQIGGIGVLAPNRRDDLSRLGLRAMIGGVLASYLTATVVGILI